MNERVCVRAGVAAAAWLSPPGRVGDDSGGPPGAAGQRRRDAERSSGGCGAPEQQSRTHCELHTASVTSPVRCELRVRCSLLPPGGDS